jgi:RNA polymerase sigma factor (sigma-70 family)
MLVQADCRREAALTVPDASFEDWVGPHLPRLRALALRLVGESDAEDVLQDALQAAWQLRSRFDPAAGSAAGWLLALVADHASRLNRKRRRRALLHQRIAGLSMEADSQLPDVDLERAIHRLSQRQRLAIELFYFLDLPVATVAEAMSCTPGTVKSLLFDARRQLGRLLEGSTDE